MPQQGPITFNPGEPPLQPWAAAKYRDVRPGYGPRASAESGARYLTCAPPGVPRILLLPFPVQIVQVPGQVIMLFEYDHFIRQIFLDRRMHPADLDPTWMGDSIGHWEGDTLVVDTIGPERQVLARPGGASALGCPACDRTVRRVDHDTLQDDLTIDDPKVYTQPWKGQQVFKLNPAWHLMEYVCEDTMPPSAP